MASRRAVEEICQLYWQPIYVFIRSLGLSVDAAEDLTQDYFQKLIRDQSFGDVHESNGRLRSYLMASVKNMIRNDYRKASALKRGGNKVVAVADVREAETSYVSEFASQTYTPEECFERRWALTLFEHALERTEVEYRESNRESLFDALKEYLTSDTEYGSYGQAAETLGMTTAAVQVAVHRLRKRYRENLIAEIASTVGNDSEIEEELQHLLAIFRR